MKKTSRSLVARAAWLPLLAGLALPVSASAQMAPAMQVNQTPTYTVALTIGPAEQMLTTDQAMMARSGEVMVSGGSMTPSNSMGAAGPSMAGPSSTDASMMMAPGMDQGMMVNHHLEAHITRNDTGAVVNDVTPTFRVTDKATGASRDLPQVMAMYGVQAGAADLHYGQNVWLPDGTYNVTVMIGPDRAVFRDLTVMDAAPMAMPGG